MKDIQTRPTQSTFESIKHIDEDGKEYWFARELMPRLGYDQWRNFHKVISKSLETLKNTYPHQLHHFVEVSKKIKVGAGSSKEATREIIDYKLTRYACYLIAQNGDPKKEAIAQAQSYFAIQTRKQEIQEENSKAIERIIARRKLSETEKKFNRVLTDRGVENSQIGIVKSAGDEALFGIPTKQVKEIMDIPQSKALADHLPTISIKAKDLAAEMSVFNAREKDLQGVEPIKEEHVNNNTAVRRMLNESGIYPERLKKEEDVKKLEKKFSEDEIKDLEDKSLKSNEVMEINICSVTNENELKVIRDVIQNNPGNSRLIIYYGEKNSPKVIERDIQLNSEVKNKLKKYIIFSKTNTIKEPV